MPVSAADYRPRDAEHAALYPVIAEHLETFLETARRHSDGSSLPEFVEQEFRDFLTCGMLEHGFARLRCSWAHGFDAQALFGSEPRIVRAGFWCSFFRRAGLARPPVDHRPTPSATRG